MAGRPFGGLVLILAAAVLSSAGPRLPRGLDLYRPIPASNALTPERTALGGRLFRDRRLSRDGSTACSTCHDRARAFADTRPVAVGVGGARGRRNVPAIINLAWSRSFFWDGRARSLEAQVLHPILNPLELGARPERVMALANTPDYRRAFQRAYGASSPGLEDVAKALASYVRSIVSGDSPFDRYASGDREAFGLSAVRGMRLFFGSAGCARCHSGPLFTDHDFHNTGVAWISAGPNEGSFDDLGRAGVTGRDTDRGAFKTPTLREVARTAPYMHDGSVRTLADVVSFYDGGGRPNPNLDTGIRALGLSAGERADLVSFLHSLTGTIVDTP